jgi:hypothetical protein
MNSQSWIRFIAIAFLLSGLGLAGITFAQLQATRRDQLAIKRQQTALALSLLKVQTRIAADRSDHLNQEAALDRARATVHGAKVAQDIKAVNAARAKNGDASNTDYYATMEQLVAKHPRLRSLYLQSFRATLSERLIPFYQMAGLTAEQVDKFEILTAKHEEKKVDLLAAAATDSLKDNDPDVEAVHQEQRVEVQNEQRAVLGEAGFEHLHSYYRASGAEAFATGAASLTVATEPYSSALFSQVFQIVANASATYKQGAVYDPSTVDWNRATDQAAKILSPEQLNAFKLEAQLRPQWIFLRAQRLQPIFRIRRAEN